MILCVLQILTLRSDFVRPNSRKLFFMLLIDLNAVPSHFPSAGYSHILTKAGDSHKVTKAGDSHT